MGGGAPCCGPACRANSPAGKACPQEVKRFLCSNACTIDSARLPHGCLPGQKQWIGCCTSPSLWLDTSSDSSLVCPSSSGFDLQPWFHKGLLLPLVQIIR